MILFLFIYSALELHKGIGLIKSNSKFKDYRVIINLCIGSQAISIGILVHGISENVSIILIFFILGLSFSLTQLCTKYVNKLEFQDI
jgi:hypothetical protein